MYIDLGLTAIALASALVFVQMSREAERADERAWWGCVGEIRNGAAWVVYSTE
jgi:hypothetical protein